VNQKHLEISSVKSTNLEGGMPHLAANLTMMFQEHEFLDRFKEAANAGFTGVEFLFPYGFEINQLVDLLEMNNLKLVLHNLPAGDWSAGERGIAILPDRIGEFQEGLGRAIEYATALDCSQLNVLSGIAPEGTSPENLNQTFIDNVSFAAAELSKHGIRLVIEAINTRDIPGFFLCGTQQSLGVIAATGSTNIKLQYDIYHMQIIEGDLASTIKNHLSSIGHIQLADNPGRHEPGTGEINFPFLLSLLDEIGYNGWIGCEYIPATTTLEGLAWFDPYK
jgi:hydroxypyruvate isomerase